MIHHWDETRRILNGKPTLKRRSNRSPADEPRWTRPKTDPNSNNTRTIERDPSAIEWSYKTGKQQARFDWVFSWDILENATPFMPHSTGFSGVFLSDVWTPIEWRYKTGKQQARFNRVCSWDILENATPYTPHSTGFSYIVLSDVWTP